MRVRLPLHNAGIGAPGDGAVIGQQVDAILRGPGGQITIHEVELAGRIVAER